MQYDLLLIDLSNPSNFSLLTAKPADVLNSILDVWKNRFGDAVSFMSNATPGKIIR